MSTNKKRKIVKIYKYATLRMNYLLSRELKLHCLENGEKMSKVLEKLVRRHLKRSSK